MDRKAPELSNAVRLALFAGLRLSSLRALRWEHVGDDALTVPLPKTGGYTIIPLSNSHIDPRLAETVQGMVRGKGPVFPVRNPAWWNTHLKLATRPLPTFGELAGSRAGNQWHLLRATWAVSCARRGATLWQLMSDGGWTVPQTVMRYVNLGHAAQKKTPS